MKYRHLLSALALLPILSFASDIEVAMTIKEHRFTPSEVRVPAGKKIKLVIHNQDNSAEEFESHELNREKIIPGNAKLPVFIGPLSPGKYPFFGEFHMDTARGVIIAE